MNPAKILKVAWRDFLETVRTKTFLISVLIVPLIFIPVMLLVNHFQKKALFGPREDRHLAAISPDDELSPELEKVFARWNENNPRHRIILELAGPGAGLEASVQKHQEEVRSGDIDGFLVIAKGVIEGEDVKSSFYTKNVTDFNFIRTSRRLLNEAVSNCRFHRHEISPKLIAELRRGIWVEEIDLSAKEGKKLDRGAAMMVPFFFMLMMFMGIVMAGQGLLNSVIEEKSSRVFEVLLAALSPFELMTGKILGQSAVGFVLLAIYGAAGYGFAASRGMADILSAGLVAWFIVYFILGFLLISSFMAAIGSVCNTVKEAGNLMGPVMMILIIPMMCWFLIAQQPEGALAVALSFIPPLTPMVMVLRIAARPDLGLLQILGSILLLLISVPAVMWASGKIFRTGILMYGKPPSLKELLRWVRSS